MKVKVITESDNWGYEALMIVVDGDDVFSVSTSPDSPEDNCLSRDLSDCFKIDDLMKLAYEAGRAGEEFTVEHKEIVEED